MRVEEYGLKDLYEARQLQKECVRLHLPSPPVVSWKIDIFDDLGEQIEKHLGKSNSYVRNGLNLIAQSVMWPTKYCMSTTVFGDGILSFKTTGSAFLILTSSFNFAGLSVENVRADSGLSLGLGYGTTAESIDLIALASTFGSGSAINQLLYGATTRNYSFDTPTRKWLGDITRTVQNGYSASQDIKETGIFVYMQGVGASTSTVPEVGQVMLMRDLLPSPISIPAGGSAAVHYNFEIQY